MEERVAALQADMKHVRGGLGEVKQDMRDFRTEVGHRFDRLEDKISRLPSEWAMARVVFYVVGALMAAAIFGPRIVSIIQS